MTTTSQNIAPDTQCSTHGCARWRCDADHTDTTAVLHQPVDETPFLAIERHIESIKPAHVAAFHGPVRRDYQAGDIVWMYDHYNTAVVTGPSSRADSWTVTTSDADGEVDTYEYLAAHIRPAAAPVEFRWVADAQAVR